jgi:hypothetical protein
LRVRKLDTIEIRIITRPDSIARMRKGVSSPTLTFTGPFPAFMSNANMMRLTILYDMGLRVKRVPAKSRQRLKVVFM